jgi:hypothetical protein
MKDKNFIKAFEKMLCNPMAMNEVINLLPAGPELNEIITEHVMGDCYHKWNYHPDYNLCDNDDYSDCSKCGVTAKKGNFNKAYSRSIEDAMLVVDYLRELRQITGGWWLTLKQIAGKEPEWNAYFIYGGPGVGMRPSYNASANTPELAICRAALKVKVFGIEQLDKKIQERTIQPAPKEGKVKLSDIERAVKEVSSKRKMRRR